MEGYTDTSYRQLIKEISPRTIVFTEFTSIDGLKFGNPKSFKRIEFKEMERPLIAQIFGSDPAIFAESTKILTDMGVDGIDINMGCPSRKIVTGCKGSALFNDPALAAEIVHATQSATHLDVSVKMRIGFGAFDLPALLNFTKGLEDAGAKHLALHGRTTKQAYTGMSDWKPIYKVKKARTIPVTGNGDITSVKDAKKKLKNLDGLMVGRGTFGNPWLMAELEHHLEGEKYEGPQTFEEKIPTILHQCQLAIDYKGEYKAMIEMRKHLANYVHGFKNATKYRFRLVRVSTLEEAKEILEEVIEASQQL